MSIPLIDRDTLVKWYCEELLLDNDIAERLGVDRRQVGAMRRAYDIPTLPRLSRCRLTESVLRREYNHELLTDREIGKKYGYAEGYIQQLRMRWNISTMKVSERTPLITEEDFRRQYLEEKKTLDAIAANLGIDLKTLLRYKKRYTIPTITRTDRVQYRWPNSDSESSAQIVLGTLLGDGHLSKHKSGNVRLEMKQSVGQQEWLEYKVRFCKSFLWMSPIKCFTPIASPGWRVADQVRSVSRVHPWLSVLYPMLYDEYRRKFISRSYLNRLGEIAVAVWFIDDGTYAHKSGLYVLCTNCFTYEEHLVIQRWFRERWSINSTIRQVTGRPNQYVLAFNKSGSQVISKMIQRITKKVPSLRYKAGETCQGLLPMQYAW